MKYIEAGLIGLACILSVVLLAAAFVVMPPVVIAACIMGVCLLAR